MESRFEVAGRVVDAKNAEHAVRLVLGRPSEGSSVVVTEWTGKITVFVARRKGRLEITEKGRI